MALQPLTLRAVSDAALVQIMLTNGLLILGEGPPRNPDWVMESHIGDAVLGSTGVQLTGRFALIAMTTPN